MLDINFIRENVEAVKENATKRGSKVSVDEILELDQQRRDLIKQVEENNRTINHSSKQKPTPEEITRLREVGNQNKELENKLKEIETTFQEKMSWLPNMSSPEMPEGQGEEDNLELKVWIPDQGYLADDKLGKGNNAAQYMPKKEGLFHHQELGEKLDIFDNKQSALTSGSRFVYLKKEAVLLQYALFNLLSQKLLAQGFSPYIPPLLVKERVLFGTSHFPEGKDQVYKIETTNVEDQQDLFLVGSSEPALFAYWMDRVIPEAQLPQKMFSMTPCFRSEVGSWGKDVRGIKRVHQFDKLEMDVVTSPEGSSEMMEELLAINEWMLQELKLPYRVVNKCTRDCGYLASYKQYDIEVWLPGQGEFMEVMTDTNATDYQSRRLNIKYQSVNGERKLVHTVNDTGAAMGRMLIAILENYQESDGSVTVPDSIRPFVQFDKIAVK